MRFEKTRQSLRQHPGPAFGKRPPGVLLPRRPVCEPSGHRRIRRLGRQVRHVKHECTAVFVLKCVANNFPCGHCETSLPRLTTRVLRQELVQWLAKPNRREARAHQDWLDCIKLSQHLSISDRILLRELAELRAGSVHIAPLRQVGPIGKRNVKNRIGIDVLKTVLTQLELIVLHHRIVEQERVRCGADIIFESAKCELRRLHAAADFRTAFEYQAAISSFRQIRGGDQAVVSCPCHHNIEPIRRSRLIAQRQMLHRKRRNCRPLYKSAPRDVAHVPSPATPSSLLPLCSFQNPLASPSRHSCPVHRLRTLRDASSCPSDTAPRSACDAAPIQQQAASRRIAPGWRLPRGNCRASCADSCARDRADSRSCAPEFCRPSNSAKNGAGIASWRRKLRA